MDQNKRRFLQAMLVAPLYGAISSAMPPQAEQKSLSRQILEKLVDNYRLFLRHEEHIEFTNQFPYVSNLKSYFLQATSMIRAQDENIFTYAVSFVLPQNDVIVKKLEEEMSLNHNEVDLNKSYFTMTVFPYAQRPPEQNYVALADFNLDDIPDTLYRINASRAGKMEIRTYPIRNEPDTNRERLNQQFKVGLEFLLQAVDTKINQKN